MPTPIELCLEDLALAEDERYLRCVALPGGEPGLALDGEGAVRWMPGDATAHGLWVSQDEQLILLRGEGTRPIAVQRGGRSLEAPAGKPVVLRDQDLLLVGERRLRVHIHGIAPVVQPPARLGRSAIAGLARAAAAAIALGSALGAVDGQAAPPPIEVRQHPPGATPAFPIDCTLSSLARSSKELYRLEARCPSGRAIIVGARGNLLDEKGSPLPEVVVVKAVKGTTIVGEVALKKPVKATKVRFYVRH
jgi:hypothetical protein